MPGSTRRSPISPTRRRARSRARSPAPCSCSVSSRMRRAGCMSISTAGRHRQSRRAPRAANARPRARSANCWANAMDDPRLTPARPDLAAKYLEGKVKAARFVIGEEFEIATALRTFAFSGPSIKLQPVDTLVMGATITVIRENGAFAVTRDGWYLPLPHVGTIDRSEEHTSELQSRLHLVCRLLLEKKKNTSSKIHSTTKNRTATITN